MVRFMIYLLETGICLSLLYLAYWLFLRKETYFNFNRLFLVGSILLALGVPLLHLSISIPLGSSLERPARGILKFRQGYGELIRYIDADFGTEPGARHTEKGSRSTGGLDEGGVIPTSYRHASAKLSESVTDRAEVRTGSHILISRILFIIYISGVLYFFVRFVYLVFRLYLLAKRNRVSRQDGFRIVEIEEEISPFSFFRFLFINNGAFTNSELDHVLEHEKAHIRQRHSTDHLFAHTLAVFQWFNPFAWQMRKALKTTHEYIADRQVMNRGIERIDYQTLLLKQVIGYHSVELVNNFNLKPIKQRIAMMNRTQSGLLAKLKATLVAPIAILIFFLFADFTLTGVEHTTLFTGTDLQGLWIGPIKDDVNHALQISGDHFSYTEGVEIRDFNMRIGNGELLLSEAPGRGETALKFEVNGDQLILWWNDDRGTIYTRSKADNTLDHLLWESGMKLQLPYISQYRLLEDETCLYRLSLGETADGKLMLAFDGHPIQLQELSGLVEQERSKLNKMDQGAITALFLVDQRVPMEKVARVRAELRKTGALHFAEGGYPQGDLNLSPLIYHAVGLPRLLPPPGAKVLDKKEMKKLGGMLHTIDLSARTTDPGSVDNGLRKFIESHSNGKYVISLEYDGDIPYGQYVESVDMVWKIVYSFRNKLAMERYSVPYDKLGDDLQREIRKAYPMALSEWLKKQ